MSGDKSEGGFGKMQEVVAEVILVVVSENYCGLAYYPLVWAPTVRG